MTIKGGKGSRSYTESSRYARNTLKKQNDCRGTEGKAWVNEATFSRKKSKS